MKPGDHKENQKHQGWNPLTRESRASSDPTTMKGEDITAAGLADRGLLDKIDKVFACNVGQYISLPQIVVVGDQSSGKSSVLEGLTDLPFPRDSGLCTRFATQIIFRRQAKTSIAVSIIPDPKATIEHASKCRAWTRNDLQELTKDAFAAIMSEVHQVMGLQAAVPGIAPAAPRSTFSRDVLQLEVCGPDQEHLSVIDVPGIFSRTTSGVTTKDDKQMIRDMVCGYMQNPRSVVLAVIPANVDIATQEILEMAEEVDSHGQRTLSVLTKPDLVDKGAEPGVVELLDGTRHKLNLGWHIVRNLGQYEMNDRSSNRSSLETAFFNVKAPWKDIEKDKTGVGSLKIRLREILAEMVRREFPKVKREINKKLSHAQQVLTALGSSRETRDDQYKYLLELSLEFQRIATCALAAQYGNHPIFEEHPKLKLATAIVDRNSRFSDDLFKAGHAVKFMEDADDAKPTQPSSSTANATSKYSITPLARYEKDHEALEDLLYKPGASQSGMKMSFGSVSTSAAPSVTAFPNSIQASFPNGDQASFPDGSQTSSPKQNQAPFTNKDYASFANPGGPILAWIEQIYKSSRGFELGTFDASILPLLWKKQSAIWDRFARGYISDIVSLVHGFVIDVLAIICPNERIREGLFFVLIDQLKERYSKATEHANFLLNVEREGTPLTTNHYFNDNLEKCRQRRFVALLDKKAWTDQASKARFVRLDAMTSTSPMSNMEHTIQDIHDILKAYYKVARKRFVDNVCMQASDHYLVTGPDTPLKLFSATFVSGLSGEQLEGIAGEDVATRRRRKGLKREIAELTAGRKILV